MKLQKLPLSIAAVLIIFITGSTTLADEWVNIWYGNPDGTPIEARIGESVGIDVYFQTSDTVYVGDAHLCLGIQDCYIDSFLSQFYAEFYYPINEWDSLFFYNPIGSPPNPNGWSSQSLIASRDLWLPFNSPPLYFTEPTLGMTLVVRSVDDINNLGDTAACIGSGLHPYLGPSAIGDTLGLAIPLTEYYSPIYFSYGTDIDNEAKFLPIGFSAVQNYPNPFNNTTVISFRLAQAGQVSLDVYNVLGQRLANLHSGYLTSGFHNFRWPGDSVPSGVYFYKLTAGANSEVKKMMLVK